MRIRDAADRGGGAAIAREPLPGRHRHRSRDGCGRGMGLPRMRRRAWLGNWGHAILSPSRSCVYPPNGRIPELAMARGAGRSTIRWRDLVEEVRSAVATRHAEFSKRREGRAERLRGPGGEGDRYTHALGDTCRAPGKWPFGCVGSRSVATISWSSAIGTCANDGTRRVRLRLSFPDIGPRRPRRYGRGASRRSDEDGYGRWIS